MHNLSVSSRIDLEINSNVEGILVGKFLPSTGDCFIPVIRSKRSVQEVFLRIYQRLELGKYFIFPFPYPEYLLPTKRVRNRPCNVLLVATHDKIVDFDRRYSTLFGQDNMRVVTNAITAMDLIA